MKKTNSTATAAGRVCVSPGNGKIGPIPSISLPPVVTCKAGVPCARDCYACKLCRIYKNLRESVNRNYSILKTDPAAFWSAVHNTLSVSRFFRYNVTGDIPDRAFFAEMVTAAAKYPECISLAFTKQYEFVNEWIEKNGPLPENLKIIFSHWPGLAMENPYDLPVSYVKFKNIDPDYIPDTAKHCNGNCTACNRSQSGCWQLKNGDAVYFDKH